METPNKPSCTKCGSSIGPEASFCQNCGSPIRSDLRPTLRPDSSDFAQRVGRKTGGILLALAAFIIICFVVWGILSNHGSQGAASGGAPSKPEEAATPAAATPKSSTATPPAPALKPASVLLPPSEVTFISTIIAFENHYRSLSSQQANALHGTVSAEEDQALDNLNKALTDLPGERDRALAAVLPRRSVENWVGRIAVMTNTSDGNINVAVTLGDMPFGDGPIKVETAYEGGTSSFLGVVGGGDGVAVVPLNSQLYKEFANFAQAQSPIVFFNGSFFPADAQNSNNDGPTTSNYIEELSFSPEGSMQAPEFLFKFTRIGKQPYEKTIPSNESATLQAEAEQSAPPEATPAAEVGISLGQTPDQVVAILGPPISITTGAKHVYTYPHFTVVFVAGHVLEIHPIP